MQVLFSLALFGFFTFASIAQTQSPCVYRIHGLILTSTDLPAIERHAIVHTFQSGTYNLDELGERMRSKLRDDGYPLVEVGAAQIKLFHSTPHTCAANVRYSVQAGSQYQFGKITFHVRPGESVFSETQLRAQFPIQNGAIFSAHKMGDGFNNLRDLYGSVGYANFVAVPYLTYDTGRHTVSLDIDVDQGLPVSFGKLLMEGVEPRAGVGQQLLTSWKEIEGKRYNPQLLKDWLKRNEASWSSEAAAQAYISPFADSDSAFNVLLHFQ